MNVRVLLICAFLFVCMAGIDSSASTEFTVYPNTAVLGSTVAFANIPRIESKVNQYPADFFDLNRTTLSYGAALSNPLGYPGGRPVIGEFPHMEFGITTGAAAYKYDRYKDFNRNNLVAPGAGAALALHAGTGLSADSDLTFKLMLDPGSTFVSVDSTHTSGSKRYTYSWDRMEFVSTGLKWRLILLKGQEDPSWIAAFRGITVGLSGDFMHFKLSGKGTYQENRNIAFNVTTLGSGTERQNVMVQSNVDGKASMGWDVVSVTPEVFAHADLFHVLSFYTGPSISLNAGKVYVSSHSSGVMKAGETIYDASGTVPIVASGASIATADMNISEYIAVPVIIPRWVLGMEINIWDVKIQLEGADVLTSPLNSFTAQFGVRCQF